MKEKAYTLVALLGTGQFRQEAGDRGDYIAMRYVFDAHYESTPQSLILQALIESRRWNITKLIVIGTKTSSWGALVPDINGEDVELYLRLLDMTEKSGRKGVDGATLKELELRLSKSLGFPVTLLSHDADFTGNNLKDNFDTYAGILDHIAPQTDILMDVTHGFRSMPLLLYQAIQLYSHEHEDVSVKIVYGELNKERTLGYIRNLSNYWELFSVSEASYAFERKLDGMKLASLIYPYWRDGASWINRFSKMVINNTCLQIGFLASILPRAMAKYRETEKTPFWMKDIMQIFNGLTDRFSSNELVNNLFTLALLFEEKQMQVQAVMTLWICVESCILQSIDDKRIGDYELWTEYGRGELNSKTKNFSKEEREALIALRKQRNLVAHGGGMDSVKGLTLPLHESAGCLFPYKLAVQHLMNDCKRIE